MIRASFTGVIKQIEYKGDLSCVFIVLDSQRDGIICTSLKCLADFSEIIEPGLHCKITGHLKLHQRKKSGKVYIDNVFYVTALEPIDRNEILDQEAGKTNQKEKEGCCG